MSDSIFVINVKDTELEGCDISNLMSILEQAFVVPKYAKAVRGNVILTFTKYDDDPRPLFEIEEIREFVRKVDAEVPFFLYYLCLIPGLHWVFLWLACLLPPQRTVQRGSDTDIMVNALDVAEILSDRIRAIRELCERILDDSEPVESDIFGAVPEEIAELARAMLAVADSS